MSPGKISKRVVADRLHWIAEMIEEIDSLPLNSREEFTSDKRNIWSAESCLRRSLEALMDLGRHILARGYGHGISEYKEIVFMLKEVGVLSDKECTELRTLAGYRNRMVHFYHEISEKELFEICSSQLSDITNVTEAIKTWINNHPELTDETV